MNDRFIEVEAASLEEARKALQAEEVVVLREFVLRTGRAGSVEGIAATVEEAAAKARASVPVGAEASPPVIKVSSQRVVLQVEGDSEESAGKGKAEVIESVSLSRKGRRGFLWFGKTRNVYEVVVAQQAVVEVGFREKARILAQVKDYVAANLLHSVEELRVKDAPWEEVVETLNPREDSQIRSSLAQLQEYECDPSSVLGSIEDECRGDETASWRETIREAHAKLLRERNRRAVELRKLDVQVAEVFMLFTAIDWFEKDYASMRKEPTGLPRTGYGKWNVNPSTSRATIPRYSTNRAAFEELAARIEGFNLYDSYLECLREEGQDEATATLEQKCIACIKARGSKG